MRRAEFSRPLPRVLHLPNAPLAWGVWRHVGGRDYESTFKEFRYNAEGALTGKVIVVVQITHEADDTLTTKAVGTFYNSAGVVTSRICPTGVATRFTGEN